MAKTSVCGLKLLVYAALSYWCMALSPDATSTHMYSHARQSLALHCGCGHSLSLSLSLSFSGALSLLSLPPSPSLCVSLSLTHVCSRMLAYARVWLSGGDTRAHTSFLFNNQAFFWLFFWLSNRVLRDPDGYITDNQAFHGLIIKPFDNQTVSLPW
jgi:hypothetical protein